MAELKTKLNKASVEKFLSTIKDEQKREDCFIISKTMEKVTKSINRLSHLNAKELVRIIKLAVKRNK